MTPVTKLKIGIIEDDKPVSLTVKLPASIHRDLVAYAEAIKREGGELVDPAMLVPPMLKRFMANDRAFKRSRRMTRQDKDGWTLRQKSRPTDGPARCPDITDRNMLLAEASVGFCAMGRPRGVISQGWRRLMN